MKHSSKNKKRPQHHAKSDYDDIDQQEKENRTDKGFYIEAGYENPPKKRKSNDVSVSRFSKDEDEDLEVEDLKIGEQEKENMNEPESY